MKTIRLLLLASTLAFAWQATGSAAVIFKDDFTGVTSATLNNAGWYSWNTSTGTGLAWSIGTSSASPLSGNVLINSSGNSKNSSVIKSFDTVTLGEGDRLIVSFDQGVDKGFGITLGFTENPLTGNQFGGSLDFEYNYGFSLSAAGTLAFRKNGSGFTTNRTGVATGGGVAHSYEFILERTGTGLLLMATADGVPVLPAQTTYTDYTFNYISLAGTSVTNVAFDNVEVLFVPEASSTLLMGAGLFVLGLPLWLKRRRLARA